jgi:hypothetical protein
MKFNEFFKRVNCEWKCPYCEYTTQLPEKAKRHAWSKHGIGIEAEAIRVKYPEKELSPEENALVVEYTGDGGEVERVELSPEENAQEVVYFGDRLNSEQREALAEHKNTEV